MKSAHAQDAARDCSVSFDHHSPDLSRGDHAYTTYAKLREECPVAHADSWGGFWAVSTYDAVKEVALDDDTYASGEGVSLPSVGTMRPLLPIESDPPDFFRYRKVLNPYFSPGAIAKWEPRVRQLADELIDKFLDDGQADLISQYSAPLPAQLTLEMLGLDTTRWPEFLAWIHAGVHESAHDLDSAVEAALEVYRELAIAIEDRREGDLDGEDLLTLMITAEPDGGPFTDEEIMDLAFLVLFGGLDTTTAAAGNAFFYLANNPDAKQMLVDDPNKIPLAVEEFLRYQAPVQGLARTVTRPTELAGQQLSPEDKVWLLWASANRDPAHFDRPDEVILDRQPNRHMAFGVGIHRCLGSNLGRLEFRVMLEQLLSRLPDYRIPDGADVSRFEDVSVVYGLKALPAVFG